MFNNFRKQFCTLIFLYLSLLLNPPVEAKSCGDLFSTYKGSSVFPVNTGTSGDSNNTASNPTIGVTINRCSNFKTYTYTLTLHPGDIKSPTNSLAVHDYYAQIATNTIVCDNKCIYVQSCSDEIKNTSPFTDCTYDDNAPSVNCDPQTSSIVINMCKRSESDGTMVGICAYISNNTGYETTINTALDYFTSAAKATINPTTAMNDFLQAASTTAAPPDSTLIGCYPVPIASLPPPFCEGKMTLYSAIDVLRICKEGEPPFRTLSDSIKTCVKPLDNMQNTFMHPCVRVTYYNPAAQSATQPVEQNADPNYSDYYTTDWKEILYTYNSIDSQDAIQITTQDKIRYTNLYNETSGNTIVASPSTFEMYGINDSGDDQDNSPYIDICGNIDATDGTITTVGTNTLTDQYGNVRTFTLELPCKDPVTEDDICPTAEDKFKQNSICVYEQRDGEEILQNCVTREEMQKPQISFCDNTFNDKNDACMQLSVPNYQGTTINYEFKGSMNECTDTPQEEEAQQLCILNSQNSNPFGFQAILTNRCYINAVTLTQLIQQNTETQQLCYANAASCTSTDKKGCTNCALDEYCWIPASDSTTGQVTGTERLCLFEYTDIYTSLSPPWCRDSTTTGSCNSVCTKTITDTITTTNTTTNTPTTTDIIRALTDIGNRTFPLPKDPSPLKSSCPYFVDTNSTDTKPSYTYRVRNPIEEDLCVDVYTVKFNKDCTAETQNETQTKAFPTQLCNDLKTFCSTTAEDSINHYQNFDKCQRTFKYCIANPTSTQQNTLDGITYTCAALSQIISP